MEMTPLQVSEVCRQPGCELREPGNAMVIHERM